MTNEEKSQKIYNITYNQCIEDGYPKKIATACAIMSKMGAEIMADWKEKQMIEKACEWLKDNIHDYYVTGEFEQWFDDMFEDFKKAMEE